MFFFIRHPDKNQDPTAQDKFIAINEAYQLLSDSEQRKHYDNFGYTQDTPQRRGGGGFPRDFDPFEDFFQFHPGSGFTFRFGKSGAGTESVFSKQRITLWTYENTIVPKSKYKPYIIFAYKDWCMLCMHAELLWERLTKDLEGIGIGYATVHTQLQPELARRVRIHSVPEIAIVIDGRVFHHKDGVEKFSSIVGFVRTSFPYELVTLLRKQHYLDSFLDGGEENKVRVVYFGRHDKPKLRYLTVAFLFRDYARFMYGVAYRAETEAACARYGVPRDGETILIFKEDDDRPAASLSMLDIPTASMREFVDANKLLVLPRLSSPRHLDALCPVEASCTRRRVCIVLLVSRCADDLAHRAALRRYVARGGGAAGEHVRFAYVYREAQPEFVGSLLQEDDRLNDSVASVVIMWRPSEDKVKYEWVESGWSADPEFRSQEHLDTAIRSFLGGGCELTREAMLKNLIDEHAKSVVGRIVSRCLSLYEYIVWDITRDEFLPLFSIIISIAFILVGGYVMAYLVNLEEENVSRTKEERNELRKKKDLEKLPKAVSLYELHGGTYDGLVRLLKPGCRTIIIFVNDEIKQHLLERFVQTIYPYRCNKSLAFAYVQLETQTDWYRRLLLQTLGPIGSVRPLNINPKNCLGTVLSLNGHRKYYCIYHPKHPGLKKGKPTKQQKQQQQQQPNEAQLNGKFIGMDDTSSDSEADLVSDQVHNDPLTGLSNWLDRLFEGSVVRYPVEYWPIMN
ncbi:PREDICTED: dnaJ homolog subfamily C member 16-like [Priapulus caudatus]|uniref:DnaJ homolog subfamily C member 16 n=1 Tax=Priapulus caudatus TaxID=37621 RepID=A0ABM1DX07_PRICU|nr:PREDICTED: dnaJ homolog subfamily C member 16-like [Priapulus caudatus]